MVEIVKSNVLSVAVGEKEKPPVAAVPPIGFLIVLGLILAEEAKKRRK